MLSQITSFRLHSTPWRWEWLRTFFLPERWCGWVEVSELAALTILPASFIRKWVFFLPDLRQTLIVLKYLPQGRLIEKFFLEKASLSSDQSRQRQGCSCGSTALSEAVRSFKHYHRTDWDLNVNLRTFQLVQRPHFIQLNSRQARWKPWWRKWPLPLAFGLSHSRALFVGKMVKQSLIGWGQQGLGIFLKRKQSLPGALFCKSL